jgi:hypothetical protein
MTSRYKQAAKLTSCLIVPSHHFKHVEINLPLPRAITRISVQRFMRVIRHASEPAATVPVRDDNTANVHEMGQDFDASDFRRRIFPPRRSTYEPDVIPLVERPIHRNVGSPRTSPSPILFLTVHRRTIHRSKTFHLILRLVLRSAHRLQQVLPLHPSHSVILKCTSSSLNT